MMTNSPKRFIAGAVCMKCGKMDTTVLYREDKLEKARCVECGYTMERILSSEELADTKNKPN